MKNFTLFGSSVPDAQLSMREDNMKKEYDLSKMKKREKVKVDPKASKMPISIRVNAMDVALIQEEAFRLGIPYQTLIGSILHRYATGDLVDSGGKPGPRAA